MFITIVRTAILYAVIIFAVRIMGKRQLSDMQPSELVITLIIADIASIPMEDTKRPILSGFIPMIILVSLELIVSVLMMKSPRFRKLICGSPIMIIENGEIQQKQMKRLRLTTEDLCVQLREQGVFSLDDVKYCIAETNGKLSVLEKPSKRNPTAEDMNLTIPDNGIEAVVINDGKFLNNSIKLVTADKKELQKLLKKEGVKERDVFIMTCDCTGKAKIIRRQL